MQILNEKIVCDADLFNLGTGYFQEKNKLLRKEMEALGNTKIDRITWRASTINLLENHRYHTDYCQLLLNKTKAQNLEKIKSRQEEKINKIKEAVRKEANVDENDVPVLNTVQTPKNPRPQKKDRPLRGIETMFRISASKNIRISEMADNKANIMISVNSIIISVILGLMARSLEENRNLIIPTVVLLIVNVATIIFSVLATRPKIANGYFTKEEVDFAKKHTFVTARNLTLVNNSQNVKADIESGLIKEGVYIAENASIDFKKSVISGFNPAILLDDAININDQNLKKIKLEQMYFNLCKGNIFVENISNNEDLESWYGNAAFSNVYSKAENNETFIDYMNDKRPDFRLRIGGITVSNED